MALTEDRIAKMAKLEAAPSEDFYHLTFAEAMLEDWSDSSQLQQMMRNELDRIASENMVLHSKLQRMGETKEKLRHTNGIVTPPAETNGNVQHLRTISKDLIEHSALLQLKDVSGFVRILVPDLKPRIAALITPGLPSYLFLLAFRYYDHADDDAALSGLFTALHGSIKSPIDRSHDLDVLGLWFVNCWRLLNLLRQYSGEEEPEEWFAQNTAKQNEQRLKRFDLRPVREKIANRVDDAYKYFMKRAIEPVLAPKVVPAILQHESAQFEILIGMNGGAQQRKGSGERQAERALSDLLEFLNFVHAKLVAFGADSVLLGVVLGQMAGWMCALALNHLMFRKEMCNFDRAFQIKHNTQEIMEWLDRKKLSHLREKLDPLIQASHLLQSRKDQQNVETLCNEVTTKLKPKQIITLLRHYVPADGIEPRLGEDFLNAVEDQLEKTRGTTGTGENGHQEETGTGGGANPLMMHTYLGRLIRRRSSTQMLPWKG